MSKQNYLFNKHFDKLAEIFNLDFVQELKSIGGDIYVVGGAVRDAIRKQKSKDTDLMVRNIEFEALIPLLEKYGTVKIVGERFGVILFNNKDFSGEVALPRIDSLDETKRGHKAIVAQSNPALTVEEDLERRDITINSIAFTVEDGIQYLIDPFNGIRDIKMGIVRMTNPDAYPQDPLRMMRTIGMAARFGYQIEEKTYEAIIAHAPKIMTISKERIFDEFNKVIENKGNLFTFTALLTNTGLFQYIFGFSFKTFPHIDDVSTIGEFLYVLSAQRNLPSTSHFCKEMFKTSNPVEQEIAALELIFKPGTALQRKFYIMQAIKIFPGILESKLCKYNSFTDFFKVGVYPKDRMDLRISGKRLESEFGLKGPQVGQAYTNMLEAVFEGKVSFKQTDELLKFIK